MKQKDKLFVTIIVRDHTGKKVAVVKNAGYEKGMARIDKIISIKYRQETPPMPRLLREMLDM